MMAQQEAEGKDRPQLPPLPPLGYCPPLITLFT
jgi:hypothetical protein